MEKLEALKRQGMQHYAAILRRKTKWHNRTIPVYIRRHLLIPYYLTTIDNVPRIGVICLPDETNPKVHFKTYLLE